jgi:hypothetical protein
MKTEDYRVKIYLMSCAIIWSLLGDFTVDRWDACPAVRFAKLWGLLRAEGLSLPSKSAAELFEDWTERLSLTPLSEAFANTLTMNERFVARLEQTLAGDLSKTAVEYQKLLGSIAQLMRAYCRATEHIAKVFTEKPDAYINPYLYIENVERWVSAPISFEFIGGGLGVTSQDYKRMNVRRARDLGNGTFAIRRLLVDKQSPGVTIFDTDNARDVADWMMWIDFFFSKFRRGDPDFDLVRLELEGKEHGVLEIPI